MADADLRQKDFDQCMARLNKTLLATIDKFGLEHAIKRALERLPREEIVIIIIITIILLLYYPCCNH